MGVCVAPTKESAFDGIYYAVMQGSGIHPQIRMRFVSSGRWKIETNCGLHHQVVYNQLYQVACKEEIIEDR